MTVEIYQYTNQGFREDNQDFIGGYEDGRSGIWVLADGLGGHTGGQAASQYAGEAALKVCRSVGRDAMYEFPYVVECANREIITRQREEKKYKNMRTTIVIAGYDADRGELLYGHVGDSRFYYFNQGELVIQSKDHSLSQMSVELGEITMDKIRFHEDRNRLVKVLGDSEELKIGKGAFGKTKIQPGDAFLLCSDGFWEPVYEEEMKIDLMKSRSPGEWIEYMVSRILGKRELKQDNFSVIGGMVQSL